MDLSLSPYSLDRKRWSAGGAVHQRFGALLKLEFPWGAGYSDYCPMNLSEENIFHKLHQFDGRCYTERSRELKELQLTNSLMFALYDSLYRAEKKSMFANIKVPESHFTLIGPVDTKSIQAVYTMGFRRCKIKVGPEMVAEKLRLLLKQVPPDLKFRLDFNESCEDLKSWNEFFKWEHSRIELIEDPIPFNPAQWQDLQFQWGVPLANDAKFARSWDGISVFKPAVDECLPKVLLNQVMVTSYLDHPVGQSFAAWLAGVIAQLNPEMMACGLLTQDIVGIQGWLRPVGNPAFNFDSSEGIGFSERWAQHQWKTVKRFDGTVLDRLFSQIPAFIRSKIQSDLNKSLESFQ